MRGANLSIKNKNGQLPVDVMPARKDIKCTTIVRLSTLLQNLMKDTQKHFHERVLSNDITNGKEMNPVQCVNEIDNEGFPTNHTYISRNCVTANVPIERNISTLQVRLSVCIACTTYNINRQHGQKSHIFYLYFQHCTCVDNCSSEDSCNCSYLSNGSWYDTEGKLKEDFDYKEPPMIFECNDMCG